MIKVWILRHGLSTFNSQHRYQGSSDESELTEAGRRSARLTAERLSPAGIGAVISSPLRRAFQTAQELLTAWRGGSADLQFEVDERLCEVGLPGWEGKSQAEVKRDFPAQVLSWRRSPYEFSVLTANGDPEYPVRSLYRRAALIWKDVLSKYAGRSVLLVTHGGTARALITSAVGLGEAYFHRIQKSNCGLSRVSFHAVSNQARLELLNDTAHLGEVLPKTKEGKRGVRLLFVSAASSNPEDYLHISGVLGRLTFERVFALEPLGCDAASRMFKAPANILPLSASEENCAGRVWEALGTIHDDRLVNLAVVTPPELLPRIIRGVAGLPYSTPELTASERASISVVHFPGPDVPPVLQAANWFEAGGSLLPESSISGSCLARLSQNSSNP